MKQIGRNDLCPCGSGKKFKKCHMGREEELILRRAETLPEDTGLRIAGLEEVRYGRTRELLDGLDIAELTGKDVEIKFVDFQAYYGLGVAGKDLPKDPGSAGIMINPKKTEKEDPNHIYIAVTKEVTDSTLIHQIAHVLDYLKGSRFIPGSGSEISMQTGIPIEHLDHPREFADWLDVLKDRFQVELDAEDTIISFLNENGRLLDADQIRTLDRAGLLIHSERIFRFMRDHKEEIDERIRDRAGYLGPQSTGAE